jgi:hypothetical protein
MAWRRAERRKAMSSRAAPWGIGTIFGCLLLLTSSLDIYVSFTVVFFPFVDVVVTALSFLTGGLSNVEGGGM